jgi:tRNA(Ile)-lysidine synthase
VTIYSSKLSRRVELTIREQGLCQPGDILIVALSGGADSTALLDVLSKLATYSLHLIAAHLNHCLRGAESDDDESFCRDLAAHHAITFESRRVDIKALAASSGVNLEDAGRRARIDFLDELLQKYNASAIAVAHHADDQAETVLMHLLRGSGMTGLSGMTYRNGRRFIRPFLDVSRAEIECYLNEHGLEWREDSSNRDTAFLRNSIRHRLMPLLRQYNPAIRARLMTTARILAAEDAFLAELALQASVDSCRQDGNGVVCSIVRLVRHPPVLLGRIIRQTCQHLAGTLEGFSQCHIEAIVRLIQSPRPNSRLSLPHGITVVREYETLQLRNSVEKPGESVVESTSELMITGPGNYPLAYGAQLSVEVTGGTDFSSPPEIAYLNQEKIPFPWLIRSFRPGDRIIPFGMSSSKKVKEIFIEKKIPLSERKRIPLLFCRDKLVWIAGLRASESCRVSSMCTKVLKLTYKC